MGCDARDEEPAHADNRHKGSTTSVLRGRGRGRGRELSSAPRSLRYISLSQHRHHHHHHHQLRRPRGAPTPLMRGNSCRSPYSFVDINNSPSRRPSFFFPPTVSSVMEYSYFPQPDQAFNFTGLTPGPIHTYETFEDHHPKDVVTVRLPPNLHEKRREGIDHQSFSADHSLGSLSRHKWLSSVGLDLSL